MFRATLEAISLWAIPVLLVLIPLAGMLRGVKVIGAGGVERDQEDVRRRLRGRLLVAGGQERRCCDSLSRFTRRW